MAASRALRSPLAVTISVWRALFLREATMRLSRNPVAWFWLIAEPAAHIAFLMWLFVIGFRVRQLAGLDTSVFIMLGVLSFHIPRNLMNGGIAAISTSQPLYAYRQVKSVDTVIARIGLDSLLACIVFIVVWMGAALAGLDVHLADPLGAMSALGALWLAGVGLALVFSVVANLNTQTEHVVRALMGPLYVFSAVMFPTSSVPPSMRDALLLNPLVHGIESLRSAFAPGYQMVRGIDLTYLVHFSVTLIILGLMLHVAFQDSLRTK